MRRKGLITVALTAALLLGISINSFAAEWKQDNKGWWYQEDDGSYPVSTWKDVNGKQYYFGADGYMWHDTTTPDGYKVGSDGAWIEEEIQKDYSEFLGNYIDANVEIDDFEDFSLCGFVINNISNGKIYGRYEQSKKFIGMNSLDTADFSSGVTFDNGDFIVNAQYSELRYNAQIRGSEEVVNNYVLKCKLDVINGTPIIYIQREGITLLNDYKEDTYIKRNVVYDNYHYRIIQ